MTCWTRGTPSCTSSCSRRRIAVSRPSPRQRRDLRAAQEDAGWSAEALAKSHEERSAFAEELDALKNVAQLVISKVLGLGSSTSTPAINLAAVPDMVQMLIVDGIFHGALGVLTSVVSHFPDLDLERLRGGYAPGMNLEEIQELGQSLVPHVQALTENITAKWVIESRLAENVADSSVVAQSEVEPGEILDTSGSAADPPAIEGPPVPATVAPGDRTEREQQA
ncbi:hypothetical protein SEVIR_3G373080v4 [Setaria viridis]|uniref:Uncharacterized protein n=1 Tax=Setaria viridis TaxID=4556 RepID=A0A4U6VN17_SETVI|nr:uncharacterized protein LOC117847256 [Setaria viridis]TKW29089.1 hypothetical protein SEVIR_3G373080v2 [Setaria viridis]